MIFYTRPSLVELTERWHTGTAGYLTVRHRQARVETALTPPNQRERYHRQIRFPLRQLGSESNYLLSLHVPHSCQLAAQLCHGFLVFNNSPSAFAIPSALLTTGKNQSILPLLYRTDGKICSQITVLILYCVNFVCFTNRKFQRKQRAFALPLLPSIFTALCVAEVRCIISRGTYKP